jgi:hypothetical protein
MAREVELVWTFAIASDRGDAMSYNKKRSVG